MGASSIGIFHIRVAIYKRRFSQKKPPWLSQVSPIVPVSNKINFLTDCLLFHLKKKAAEMVRIRLLFPVGPFRQAPSTAGGSGPRKQVSGQQKWRLCVLLNASIDSCGKNKNSFVPPPPPSCRSGEVPEFLDKCLMDDWNVAVGGPRNFSQGN